MQIEIDQEALDAAYSHINYFSNLPNHIKRSVSHYYPTSFNTSNYIIEPQQVVHLIEGTTTTVINGKLNMLDLTLVDQSTEFKSCY